MITGVDQPRNGISVFHRTFLVSLHSSGSPTVFSSPGAETWPSPNGPRKSGQSARADVTTKTKAISVSTTECARVFPMAATYLAEQEESIFLRNGLSLSPRISIQHIRQ